MYITAIRGYHDDGHPLLYQLIHQSIDLLLGSHINAPCRLIKNNDVGLGCQSLGNYHLLLVASG